VWTSQLVRGLLIAYLGFYLGLLDVLFFTIEFYSDKLDFIYYYLLFLLLLDYFISCYGGYYLVSSDAADDTFSTAPPAPLQMLRLWGRALGEGDKIKTLGIAF
jgi:hypothetical protein